MSLPRLPIPLAFRPPFRGRVSTTRLRIFLRWALNTLIVLLGVSVVSFALIHLTPGDPAEDLLRAEGVEPTREMVEALRHQLGLDRPVPEQYLGWLVGVLQGDLGTSLANGTEIGAQFQQRLPRTLALTVTALIISWLIAVPVGLAAAARQNSRFDSIVRALSYASSALPGFVVALLVLQLLGVEWKWFPIAATQDAVGMVMPVITLVVSMVGWYVRQIRAIALEEHDKAYVPGLRIRGLSEVRVSVHVLRNVAAPLCTLAGSSFGAMLAGSAVVESIFSWRGLGQYGLEGIANKDYPVVQAYVLWCALVFLVANALADLAALTLDPRMADQEHRTPASAAVTPTAEPSTVTEALAIDHPDLSQLTPVPRGTAGTRWALSAVVRWRLLAGSLLLVAVIGLLADTLTAHDAGEPSLVAALQPPSSDYPFGTDELGRDILSRILAGIRPTLTLAVTVVICSLLVGTLIGVVSATAGRFVDAGLQRVTAVFQAFPEFILALAFASMLGPGFTSAAIALTAVYWTRIARYSRILTMQVKNAPFIQIARMNGVKSRWIAVRHVLPNIGSPVLVMAAADLGSVILNLATLSFVGLGLPRPTAEWGTMISEGRSYIQVAPWLVIGPGIALFVVILLFNLFADTSQELLSAPQRPRRNNPKKGNSLENTTSGRSGRTDHPVDDRQLHEPGR